MKLPPQYGWFVYEGAPSADERHILLSYHGRNTTGIDSFDVTRGEPVRCTGQPAPNVGCVGGHGVFLRMGDRMLVATGMPEILEYNAGVLDRVFNTRLERNHLMEFAVDPERQRLYAAGPCAFAGGLSVVDLNGGGQEAKLDADGRFWELLGNPPAPPRILLTNPEICGDRIAVGNGSLIVLMQAHGPGPEALDTPGAILFIDGASGRLLSRFTPKSQAVDVAIVSKN